MKKNKKAFSLIEIIIASSILSVTVFGVYKLIGENAKLINNSNNYLQLNNLFLNLEECIKNKKYSTFSSDIIDSEKTYNFGDNLNGCEIGTSAGVVIDNIEYYLNSKLLEKNTDFINFELTIEGEGIAIEKKEFRLYK